MLAARQYLWPARLLSFEYLSKGEKLIPPQHRSPRQSSNSHFINTANYKEVRKVSFDSRRSERIAAMMRDHSNDSDYDSDDADDSNDADDDSDSSSEYDSDDKADEDNDGE